MVDGVVGAAAGVGIEIPAEETADVVGGTGGRMRAVGDDAARCDICVLAAGELFVGFKHIENARAITRIEGGGAAIGPIKGFEGAVQEEALSVRAAAAELVALPPSPRKAGLEQDGRRAGDERGGVAGVVGGAVMSGLARPLSVVGPMLLAEVPYAPTPMPL